MGASERKQVTVMFADITGFTALSERLDPEQVTETVNRLFKLFSEPIQKYDGTIDKFMGDAVMVLFGAPRTHENDAERAIRCALDMLAAMQTARQTLPFGHALNLHIGLNTGLVIAGQVGTDQKMEYTVIGDTANLASRLQDAAPPGTIYVGESTFRLTQRLFDVRPVEPLQLKGKSEPVAAFAVEGAKSGVINTRGIEGLRSPLVGRDQQRGELLDSLIDLAKRKRGEIVFVIGEAGWGKSRLLTEVRDQMGAPRSLYENIRWLEGRGLALAQDIAYFPITDLFKRMLGLMEEEISREQQINLEEILRQTFTPTLWYDIAPFFKSFIGLELDPISAEKIKYLEAENLRRQVFYAIRQAVRAMARTRPLVFVIDDLHWADASTLEVLQYLIPLVEDSPILFLFVTRLEEGERALDIRDWVRKEYPSRYKEILLEPLTMEQSQEMLGNLLGAENLPADTRDFILSRAEGNPFYIEEVVRWLLERGWIVRDEEGWRVIGKIDTQELPPTLLGLISARIDRLEPDLKETLQTAAVIGRSFSIGLLEKIVSQNIKLDDHLARLEKMELVFKRQDPRRREYEFKHILTQSAGYESLLVRRRRELHGQVAQALEKFYGKRPEDQIAFVAYHYGLSDHGAKAIDYAIQAGEHALAAYTPNEAARYFRQALTRLQTDGVRDNAQRARILIGLGDAESAQGDSDAALVDWARALELSRDQKEMEAVASIHRRMGTAAWAKGDSEAALKFFQDGLAALDGQPASKERAALFHEIGRLYFRIGDNARAVEWAKQALELGEQLGAHEAIAQAHNTLGIALARGGEIENGIEYVNKGLRVALEHDLLSAACRAYTNLGMLYAAVDHDKSIQYCNDGLALAKKIGDLSYESWIQSALASNWCSLEGDWEQGISAARSSIELDRLLGQRNHLAVPLILLAQIYQCHRQNTQSEMFYREAQGIAEKVGDPQLLFPIYDGLAALNLEKGNQKLAEEYLEKSRQTAERGGYMGDTLLVVPFLN